MEAWIAENWGKILLTLVSSGALALCTWLWSQIKNYKALIDEKKAEKEAEKMEEAIEEKLTPILDEIEDLRTYIRNVDTINQHHLNLIIASYRYRLVQLCKIYLKQGFLTPMQFDQINEFYTLYHELGGNSNADSYYQKIKMLEIKNDDTAEVL